MTCWSITIFFPVELGMKYDDMNMWMSISPSSHLFHHVTVLYNPAISLWQFSCGAANTCWDFGNIFRQVLIERRRHCSAADLGERRKHFDNIKRTFTRNLNVQEQITENTHWTERIVHMWNSQCVFPHHFTAALNSDTLRFYWRLRHQC